MRRGNLQDAFVEARFLSRLRKPSFPLTGLYRFRTPA
jgi:hypothetical protein